MITKPRTSPAREKILDAAGHLFYENGFRAVGIDTIIAKAGVAKMSLYAHFASKDDLIVAYLERANDEFWVWLDEATADAETPKAKLIAIFEALRDLTGSIKCLGCTFQATAAEFPNPDSRAHRVAMDGKEELRRRFRELAEQAELRDPASLADQLLLLMDGAYASARMFGPTNPARHVADAARALIEAQSPPAS